MKLKMSSKPLLDSFYGIRGFQLNAISSYNIFIMVAYLFVKNKYQNSNHTFFASFQHATFSVFRWWKRRCTVVEHRAGHTMSSTARIIQNHDETITIRGRFTRRIDPDFRLHLSSQMNRDEFARGYLMTGALQLGDLKGTGQLKITHFAVLPRL